MDNTIPIELLLRLINATPEQCAIVANLQGATVKLQAARPAARFMFRQAGSHWDVVFDGSEMFHLPGNLGTKYIGYFLHHANAPVSAFDAERMIQPEKAQVRAKDSIQGHLDAEAVRAYLRQLDALRDQRAEAAEDGNLALADQLDEDIAAIEAELKRPGQAADAGERARVNVNKAVTSVLRHHAARRAQAESPTECDQHPRRHRQAGTHGLVARTGGDGGVDFAASCR